VPRLCIKLHTGIRLTAEENHGETSVGVAEKRPTEDCWAPFVWSTLWPFPHIANYRIGLTQSARDVAVLCCVICMLVRVLLLYEADSRLMALRGNGWCAACGSRPIPTRPSSRFTLTEYRSKNYRLIHQQMHN
jgi:hypothetical protein